MHDIRAIREDPAAFDAALARRGLPASSHNVLELDANRRDALTGQQNYQTKRNDYAKRIGLLKRQGADTSSEQAEAAELNALIESCASLAADTEQQMQAVLSALPNRLDDSVPAGEDEDANIELKQFGSRASFANPSA
jgi:seryl-tRNA synthetase